MSELAERLEQTVLLLRALPDYDYVPETSTGNLVRRRAKPGGRNQARELCLSCGYTDHPGKKRVRGMLVPCEECGERGWIVVDQYTRHRIGSEEGGLVSKQRWVRCDAGCVRGLHGNGQNCRHCSDSGRPGYVRAPEQTIRFRAHGVVVEVEIRGGSGDPIIDSWERRRLAGSFAELVDALAFLRERWLLGFRLIAQVYIFANKEPDDLPDSLRRRLDVALRILERKMPVEIRVPASARANERRRKGRRGNGIAA